MQVSTAIAKKSQRLLDQGRVSRVGSLDGHVYEVAGDSSVYTVVVSDPAEAAGRCTCPAGAYDGQPCSHLLAASAFDLADPRLREVGRSVEPPVKPDPFRGLV